MTVKNERQIAAHIKNIICSILHIGGNMKNTTKFDLGIIPRLVLFVALSGAVSTPLRIFEESVVEGRTGAPDFVTVPFIIYGICAKLIVGLGYVLFGHRLPVKNNILRAFAYMMLILFSSYLPNILAMAGGDGELIASSLSAGIVVVDTLTYVIEGIILGLLMKKYDLPLTSNSDAVSKSGFIRLCVINGILFAGMNLLTDILAGLGSRSWRLCSILGVSAGREMFFYTVFTLFMFTAGALLTLWYRCCMPENIPLSEAVMSALKITAVVWLPNVLIMAFFGTSLSLTLAYGGAYAVMITVCVLMYRRLSRVGRRGAVCELR